MIELNVEEYCHNCPNFEPVINRLFADNKCQGTVIICRDKFTCNSIKSYLKDVATREKHSPL